MFISRRLDVGNPSMLLALLMECLMRCRLVEADLHSCGPVRKEDDAAVFRWPLVQRREAEKRLEVILKYLARSCVSGSNRPQVCGSGSFDKKPLEPALSCQIDDQQDQRVDAARDPFEQAEAAAPMVLERYFSAPIAGRKREGCRSGSLRANAQSASASASTISAPLHLPVYPPRPLACGSELKMQRKARWRKRARCIHYDRAPRPELTAELVAGRP